MKSHKFGKNSDGDPRSEPGMTKNKPSWRSPVKPGMTRKLTKLTVMPDLIGHLKLKNYDRKSDLPYGIRGFHDDV